MAQIIDGKLISQTIKDEVKAKVEKIKAEGGEISLAVVQVGDDKASGVYVNNKKKACEYVGFRSVSYHLPEDTQEDELVDLVRQLNEDSSITGILVQLPLPSHIREEKIIETIDPKKDVDGFNAVNVGNLSIGRKGFISCTPYGIVQLLKRSGIETEGRHCVIIGRSNIVGKPMSMLMLRENATVTVVHSKTKNIKEITRQADILIVAIGKPKYVDETYVKEGAVVIDVGINRDENNKLCGDVDYDRVADKVKAITPVPGGVGPMTIAMLMQNCLEAYELYVRKNHS